MKQFLNKIPNETFDELVFDIQFQRTYWSYEKTI